MPRADVMDKREALCLTAKSLERQYASLGVLVGGKFTRLYGLLGSVSLYGRDSCTHLPR